MDKKEEFKIFIKSHPEVIEEIKNKTTTWQELYEIYDIYGSNDEVWNKYFIKNEDNNINELTNLFKNINMDNIQKHINNAQKAVNLIQEITSKSTTNVVKPSIRPITKFFGD